MKKQFAFVVALVGMVLPCLAATQNYNGNQKLNGIMSSITNVSDHYSGLADGMTNTDGSPLASTIQVATAITAASTNKPIYITQIPVTTNYVVSTADLASFGTNLTYLIYSTPSNATPLLFTFPIPPASPINLTLVNEGTNAVTLTNGFGTNSFWVDAGGVPVFTNQVSLKYFGKSMTWQSFAPTNWLLVNVYRPSAEIQNLLGWTNGSLTIPTNLIVRGSITSDGGNFTTDGAGNMATKSWANNNSTASISASGNVVFSGFLSFGGTAFGNGNNFTNLNATTLLTGTVPDARLSANVALLNGSQTFTGSNSFSGTNVFITTPSTAAAVSTLGIDANNRVTTNVVSGGGSTPNGLYTNNSGTILNIPGGASTNSIGTNSINMTNSAGGYFNASTTASSQSGSETVVGITNTGNYVGSGNITNGGTFTNNGVIMAQSSIVIDSASFLKTTTIRSSSGNAGPQVTVVTGASLTSGFNSQLSVGGISGSGSGYTGSSASAGTYVGLLVQPGAPTTLSGSAGVILAMIGTNSAVNPISTGGAFVRLIDAALSTTNHFVVAQTGASISVGINNTNPIAALDVIGNANLTGMVTAGSNNIVTNISAQVSLSTDLIPGKWNLQVGARGSIVVSAYATATLSTSAIGSLMFSNPVTGTIQSISMFSIPAGVLAADTQTNTLTIPQLPPGSMFALTNCLPVPGTTYWTIAE